MDQHYNVFANNNDVSWPLSSTTSELHQKRITKTKIQQKVIAGKNNLYTLHFNLL